MTRATASRLFCTLAAVLVWLPATSAPTLPEAPGTIPAGTAAGTGAADAVDRAGTAAAGVTDIPDQSRTIRMLLEMQTSSAAAEAEERKRQQEKEGRAAAARLAPVQAPTGTRTATPALGGGSELEKARAPTAEELRTPEWAGTVGAPLGVGGGVAGDGALRAGGAVPIQAAETYPGPRPTSGPPAGEGRVIRLLPPELIRWLREYRVELIVGSVALLIMASVGTSLASRRPR